MGDIVADFESLRTFGFSNINLDLIAGLAGQSRDTWSNSLSWIERLRPDHVSIYLLDLEEQSACSRSMPNRVGDDLAVWSYREAAERLETAGYVHYEITSWALPGLECRHNLKYWTGALYRGVGVGAHSLMDGRRFWNTTSLEEYARKLDSGELPVSGYEEITSDVALAEAFLLGLRRTGGFRVRQVAAAFSIDYPAEWFRRVEALTSEGLVEFDGDVLKLRPSGWLLANGITEELLCPIQ